jgi:4-amino-4-deoxy-L-arabinose transferase-like glycosyltransferase
LATLTAPVGRTTEFSTRRGQRWLLALVFTLFAVIYVGAMFSPALQDDADSTHAEAAREMLVKGDYVTLHVNGIRYLEKAPLMYWAVAFSYRVFGVNEFATHLPTTLSMLFLVWLAIHWGRRAFDPRTGTCAGLFITTTAGYFLFTRILIPEAILSALIAASMYLVATALSSSDRKQQAWRWYGAYACLALAVLTKGLLAIVIIGGTLFWYAIVSGEWRRWREFRLATGLLLFVAIAAPWHILAGLRNPGFFWFYFVNEHFLRFIGKRYPVDYNKLPATLYWSLHLVWLFPWSLYLPVLIRRMWRERTSLRRDFPQGLKPASFANVIGTAKAVPFPDLAWRTRLLCATWAIVLLVFFAFSTNQEYYTFPAYFPIVLLIAWGIATAETSADLAPPDELRSRTWLGPCAAALAFVCLAGSGVLIVGLWSSRHLPYVSDIGTVLAATNLEENTLSMGHMLSLTGQSFAALRLPAIIAAIALGIGPALAFLFRLRRRHLQATLATALAIAALLIAAHIALIRFDPYLSSKRLAQTIAHELKPSDRVMIYGDQAFGSSLLFYLRRPIELVNGRTTSMWFGSTYPDAPKIFLDDAGLRAAWNSGSRIFLYVPQHQLKRVARVLPEKKYVVAESSGRIVYSNRP